MKRKREEYNMEELQKGEIQKRYEEDITQGEVQSLEEEWRRMDRINYSKSNRNSHSYKRTITGREVIR